MRVSTYLCMCVSDFPLLDFFLAGVIRIDLNNATVVKGLCIVLKQKVPDVSTIIFSSNEIKRLAGFQAISSHLRHIRGLSFANNQIQDFRELDHLRDLKHLRDLVLTGNPILSKGDDANYRRCAWWHLVLLRVQFACLVSC
jgi:Leucine-rich repeat (LRR) protein